MQNKQLPLKCWRNEISFTRPKICLFSFSWGSCFCAEISRDKWPRKNIGDTTPHAEQKQRAASAITISRCVRIEAAQSASSIFKERVQFLIWPGTNEQTAPEAGGQERELSREPLSTISSYHSQFHAAVNLGNSITLFVPVLSERTHTGLLRFSARCRNKKHLIELARAQTQTRRIRATCLYVFACFV